MDEMSVDKMQGQMDVMNQRINQLTDGLIEVGKMGTMSRESMASDMKGSLQRIHERIDDLFKEVHSLKEINAELAKVQTRVEHHDWLLKASLTAGIGGLITALWSVVSRMKGL